MNTPMRAPRITREPLYRFAKAKPLESHPPPQMPQKALHLGLPSLGNS
jgi:hypothetical protein